MKRLRPIQRERYKDNNIADTKRIRGRPLRKEISQTKSLALYLDKM